MIRTGSQPGPASPTSSTPIDNIWMTVFHFASRDTGMRTLHARQMLAQTRNQDLAHQNHQRGQHGEIREAWYTASMNNVVATSSLSAIGSRKRPAPIAGPGARDLPSSQSVRPASEKMTQPSQGPAGGRR